MSNKLEATSIISDSQRQCLTHILRNCEESISSILGLLEDGYSQFSTEEVAGTLSNTCKQLDRILKATESGTFCAVPANECKFISYFVGCKGEPLRNAAEKSSALNVIDSDNE